MKKIIALFLLIATFSVAQVDRVQIKGVISTDAQGALDGITIFNNNTLEGTITNDDGVFYIDVTTGDQLSFKALQFESFTLKVNEQVLGQKEIQVTLNEDIKDLEEVVINDQSFMIPVKRVETVDAGLEKVSVDNIKRAAVDRMENTFSDRVRKPEEYQVVQLAASQSQPRFNMVGPSAVINTSRIAQSLDVKNINKDDSVPVENNALVLLKNKYSKEYLMDYLDLKENELLEFKYFAKDHGLTKELVMGNELELLQFLTEQSIAFKKRKS